MATKTIKNSADMSAIFASISIKILNDIATKVYEQWKEEIRVGWYEAYEPWVYNRTFKALDSLTKTEVKKVGKYYEVSVFLDESIADQGHPNSQGDFTGREVLDVIEQEGMDLINGVHRDPIHAFDTITTWLISDFKSYLSRQLKIEFGVTAKVG